MCKSATAHPHSISISSTSSSSCQKLSFDESNLSIDTKQQVRSRRSSSSSLPQPRGLRMAVRAKIYNDKMIAAHKACLASIADLIAYQREDIVMLNELTRRAECGIPPMPKQASEKSRRDLAKLQAESVNTQFQELAVLHKKNRGRKMPEEAEAILHMINVERQVQARLVAEATAIFEELQRKYAKMGAEHSLLLSSCCENCENEAETASAA